MFLGLSLTIKSYDEPKSSWVQIQDLRIDLNTIKNYEIRSNEIHINSIDEVEPENLNVAGRLSLVLSFENFHQAATVVEKLDKHFGINKI
jgi:hypothetical protein